MKEKWRPNVIVLAVIVASMTVLFGLQLIAKIELLASQEILALLVGIGIGGIMTLAGQVATDPPPPTVPASIVERLIDKAEK